MEAKIKIILISGFLGAGKTTLIRRLLGSEIPPRGTVILENEFGRADIDGELLRSGGLTVVSVRAGCICCTGAGDFLSAIGELREKFAPERIIIEPTGLAKLSEIIALLTDPSGLGKICTLRRIITVVDASSFNRRMLISKVFFEDQIKNAEEISLNRTEKLTSDEIADIYSQINSIRMSPEKPFTHNQNPIDDIHSAYISDLIPRSGKFISELSEALSNGVFGEILRVKGWILQQDGAANTLDYTPGEFSFGGAVSKESTELCFIGKNIDGIIIRRFFNEDKNNS